MKIDCVLEHNGNDSILYADKIVGAFTRGASKEEAIAKMPEEIRRYRLWQGEAPFDDYDIEIVQEKESDLKIADADSDVLFVTEKAPLSIEEYQYLKSLAMKSAEDFYALSVHFLIKIRVHFRIARRFTVLCLVLRKKCTGIRKMLMNIIFLKLA